MTDGWAALDYESTPEELRETLALFEDAEPGAHGLVEVVPAMEGYLMYARGVFWGQREVLDSGIVRLAWVRFDCPHGGEH